jgi:hypothetical protein
VPVEAKVIDPAMPIYDIARGLNIAPARVRGLLLNWQLRTTKAETDLRRSIVDALKKTRFSKDGTLLTFGVESRLLKEEIAARLKRTGVFPDAAFSKELVKLPVEAFVDFLDEIVDEDTKKEVRTTLVKDKLLIRWDAVLRLVCARSQTITVPAPYWPSGITPSTSA